MCVYYGRSWLMVVQVKRTTESTIFIRHYVCMLCIGSKYQLVLIGNNVGEAERFYLATTIYASSCKRTLLAWLRSYE